MRRFRPSSPHFAERMPMSNAQPDRSAGEQTTTMTRRQALAAGAAALAVGLSRGARQAFAAATEPAAAPPPHTRPADKRFLVAVDDLFLLQRQNVKAFDLAKDCGL